MRILKELQALEEQDIGIKAKLEQEQLRVKVRREQLDLEERLAKLERPVADTEMQSVMQGHSDSP